MTKRATRLLAGLIAGALCATTMSAATAAPTCPDPVTRPACGGRVIPGALTSGSYIQYWNEYVPVLDAIEGIAPGIIDVKKIGEWLGSPTEMDSFGGRDIYVIRITDESVETPKKQVAISLSVHGIESAGREGGLRYVEDIAQWWAGGDRDHALYAGDTAVELDEVLAELEIYVSVLNVDGWASGDIDPVKWATRSGSPGTFRRGNDNGANAVPTSGSDLNRDFPTLGWTGQDQPTEPEAIAWVQLVSSFRNLVTATDIHGELTSANDAFSDIMYPAGQWDAKELAQEEQFALNMNRTVERKFVEEGVLLQNAFDLRGEDRPMKPANFATAYDVVGYDDSGFMGDWFVSEGAVELDVENFLSHLAPASAWIGTLEQAHVAAVKGNMEATIAEAMITGDVSPDLDLGRIAYVFDPRRVQRFAEEGAAAYDASRMDYFDELRAATGATIVPVPSASLYERDLDEFDSVVLADDPLPPDLEGRAVDEQAYVAALDSFVRGGGQLVLTDGAINLLVTLGLVAPGDVKFSRSEAGHVEFGDRNHRWEQDLTGVPSQTYYAVPLGYNSDAAQGPIWGIAEAAWTAKGGVTAGTVSDGGTVNLGELPHGSGSIAIFGAILPTQQPAVVGGPAPFGMSAANRIDHGLADYAISVAGGTILHSILEFHRGDAIGELPGGGAPAPSSGRGNIDELHAR